MRILDAILHCDEASDGPEGPAELGLVYGENEVFATQRVGVILTFVAAAVRLLSHIR